jgi:hypothetical protein
VLGPILIANAARRKELAFVDRRVGVASSSLGRGLSEELVDEELSEQQLPLFYSLDESDPDIVIAPGSPYPYRAPETKSFRQ